MKLKKTINMINNKQLNRLIQESINEFLLMETDCAGAMQTGCGEGTPKGSNPESGQYTVPFGADPETADRTPGFSVMRREIYKPKGGEKKNKSKLGESRINKIINESIRKILTEGEEWIGDFDGSTFDMLRRKVDEYNGTCSFSLNGTDFTIAPSQRGFMITSGTDFVYESFKIDSALKAAWKFSNMAR